MITLWARRGEQLAVVLIVLGILFMIQPLTVYLLSYGFVIVLVGLILFIITSHL